MRTGILTALAAAGLSLMFGASAWAQSLPLPAGSYQRTCVDERASVQGGGKLLAARCQKAGGGYEITALRYENCRGDIANNNGRLVCAGGGGTPPPVVTPAGSYKASCANIYMQRGILHASCKDRRGAWINSSIDPATCRGRDIANNNGRLSCTGGPGGGGAIPAGSYRNSCTNAYMTGFVLHADCRDSRGRLMRTTLDTRTCGNRDIANINGRLTCGSGGVVPPGAGAITLYTQPGFNGRSATITRAAPSLGRWEMANKARSVRIRSGRWLACTEANYRGRCVILDRNQRDLRAVGLDRRISSLRPAR